MGQKSPRPLVLDTGALIAWERGASKVVTALALAEKLHVPAGVVSQAWRNPARQVRLVRLISAEQVTVHPLDEDRAKAAGGVLAGSGTNDVVDASVVVLARELGATVVTSDADDLRRLGPELDLMPI